MTKMKLVIAGGRDFTDYNMLCRALSTYGGPEDLEIVSGGASGADTLGEKYAKEHGIDLKIFPAEWAKYGRAAGPIRNREMAEYCDQALIFWDGKSGGTANMIEQMKQLGKHNSYRVFMYNDKPKFHPIPGLSRK